MAAHERTCCRKMAPIRGAGSANVASMSARNSYEQECENDSKRVRMVADDGDEDGTHTFWTWMISGRLEKILERSAGLMMGFLVCVLASIGSYHTWHRAVAAEQQRRREIERASEQVIVVPRGQRTESVGENDTSNTYGLAQLERRNVGAFGREHLLGDGHTAAVGIVGTERRTGGRGRAGGARGFALTRTHSSRTERDSRGSCLVERDGRGRRRGRAGHAVALSERGTSVCVCV